MMARLVIVVLVALVVWVAFAAGKALVLRGSRRAVANDGWGDVELGDGIAVVLFRGPECAQCARQRAAIESARSGRAGVGYAEVDASVNRDLASRLVVLSVPTTIVVGPAGEVLFRNGRPVDSALLDRQLDAALGTNSAHLNTARTRPQ